MEQTQDRGSLWRRATLFLGLFVAALVCLSPSAKAYEFIEYSALLDPGEVRTPPGYGGELPVTGVMASYSAGGNTTVCAGYDSLYSVGTDFRTCGVNYAGNARNAMHLYKNALSYAFIENGGTKNSQYIQATVAIQYDTLAAAGTGTTHAKERLNPGQYLESPNRAYSFVMQTDGNAVVYNRSSGKACWHTNTSGHPGAYARMQSDGNFVVYSAGGSPLYATYTTGLSRLVMQDDGNLVMYQSGTNTPKWATSWLTGQIGC